MCCTIAEFGERRRAGRFDNPGLRMRALRLLQRLCLGVLFACPLWQLGHAADRPNVLFIMCDQLRWDAISPNGNAVVQTPNIERLVREGVNFTNAYSACPVCVPARTSILTGMPIYRTGILSNRHVTERPPEGMQTFDQLLAKAGYSCEYYGKWHAPYELTNCYQNRVMAVGRKLPGVPSQVEAFRAFLERCCPRRPPGPGELLDNMSQRPYIPLPIDWRYELRGTRRATERTSQAGSYGKLLVPPNCSLAAFQGTLALNALRRLAAREPFSLTCSFSPPHPPMVVPDPYFSLYRVEDMPVPESIDDPHRYSPHPPRENPVVERYRNPDRIREMKKVYYALVTQVDEWIGRLLDELEKQGLLERTLIVFTSDHGEMLGDHGMHGKGVMFEGAVRVPLVVRFPRAEFAGTVVDKPVDHLNIFPTILAACGLSDAQSVTHDVPLQQFVRGETPEQPIAVSEWWANGQGPLMVRSGEWKLILYTSQDPPPGRHHALYNLREDPLELRNLLGPPEQRRAYAPVAERLRRQLLEWMERTDHPLRSRVEGIHFHENSRDH